MTGIHVLPILAFVGVLCLANQGLRADEAQQKEPPARELTAGEIEIGEPGTRIEDTSVAKREVARFQKAMKAAGKKDWAKQTELLQRLARWDHPEVMKAAKKYLSARDFRVSVAAAVVVARQSDRKKAGAMLVSALKREKRTNVICALLVGMGRVGYDKDNGRKLAEKFFRRDTTESHKAATRYFGYIKRKEYFRMLADKLDEPRPLRPDDPKNPPASWWKERWEEWETNVPYTRWALSQLVEGETFETRSEAKLWAESEGAKHGVEW